jgi:benzoyl-CoA reductase/2-hydroxyglutaryl-CoA dehydratase subunit BcrC/BadD/HgdB
VTETREDIARYHAQHLAGVRAARAEGQVVVGYVGLDVPEELILAADLVPLRLEADVLNPNEAAARFDVGGHPVLRSLVGELLGGRYQFVDHLVIATMPRNLATLAVLFQELRQSDPAFGRFQVHLLDVLHSDSPSATRFTLDSLRRLAQQLDQWSGGRLDDGRLRGAVQACNETRRLLAQHDALRADGRHLDGVAALRLHSCATGGDRARFNAQLRAWLPAAAPAHSESPARVLYSGTATDTTTFYAGIEAHGLRIVDDDQDFGARAVGPLVDEHAAPLDALAQTYARRAPAPAGWSSEARRRYLLARIAACRPDGVLFYHAAYDHPPSWEYPLLRAAVEDAGVPSALIDAHAYRDMTLLAGGAGSFAQHLETRRRESVP